MIRPLVCPRCNERCAWFVSPSDDSKFGICTFGGCFKDEPNDWWVSRDARCMDDDMYERKTRWN